MEARRSCGPSIFRPVRFDGRCRKPVPRIRRLYFEIVMFRDWKWSSAEKAVARRAFDAALQRELESVMRDARERMARVREIHELWELERWMGERRTGIDSKYDYRYSMLPLVFGNLIREGRISERDLEGLAEEKLDTIRNLSRW
jgi:hypothetical protein